MKTIPSPSESLRRASCASISDNDCHSLAIGWQVEKHEGIDHSMMELPEVAGLARCRSTGFKSNKRNRHYLTVFNHALWSWSSSVPKPSHHERHVQDGDPACEELSLVPEGADVGGTNTASHSRRSREYCSVCL